jgi:hypothetical protein
MENDLNCVCNGVFYDMGNVLVADSRSAGCFEYLYYQRMYFIDTVPTLEFMILLVG